MNRIRKLEMTQLSVNRPQQFKKLLSKLLSKLSPMKEAYSLPVRILSSKTWNDIANKLFGDKLVVDERNAILSFTWPWTDLKCHVLPPYMSFYTQLTLVSGILYLSHVYIHVYVCMCGISSCCSEMTYFVDIH